MDEGFETSFREGCAQVLKLARIRLSRERSPVLTMTLAHELYLSLRDRDDLRGPLTSFVVELAGGPLSAAAADPQRAITLTVP